MVVKVAVIPEPKENIIVLTATLHEVVILETAGDQSETQTKGGVGIELVTLHVVYTCLYQVAESLSINQVNTYIHSLCVTL